ncbi:MAG: NAD(P)H-quinone oxidoreductase [Acidobacteriota bacterium]
MMKAVYIQEPGEDAVVAFSDVPDLPKPVGSLVLVRVKAAGLNRADLMQRRGLYPPPAGYSLSIPGLEFAGEAVECGPDAHNIKTGDRICGITAGEAQAEYVLVDSSTLIHIPEILTYTDAAAIPEAFITAHDAICTLGEIKSDETLLVHAVGSGVGLAALQMARMAGARVIGTSRTNSKLTQAVQHGLNDAILAEKDSNFAVRVSELTDGRGVDVVLDLVGGSYFAENLDSLANKGRLILVGLTGGGKAEFDLRKALYKRLRIVGTVLRARSIEEKAEATRLFVDHQMKNFIDGSIKPVVDRVFPAEEANAAYDHLASNGSFGKVILEF